MSGWQPVPAEIESLDLTTRNANDSSTYQVRATYRYSLDGRSYTGDRVAIGRMADNIGSFQHDLYASLRNAQADGRVTAYVDPTRPVERDVESRSAAPVARGSKRMFALVFGGVGLALAFGGGIGARKLAEKRELEARYAGQPWRWRADWSAGAVRSSSRATAYGTAGFAVLWNVVADSHRHLRVARDRERALRRARRTAVSRSPARASRSGPHASGCARGGSRARRCSCNACRSRSAADCAARSTSTERRMTCANSRSS